MNHHIIRDEGGWETVSIDPLYTGPYISLSVEHVRSPMRRETFPWTVARRKVGSMVIPVTLDGRFIMIRQERVPIRTTLWEFPAGQVDDSFAPDDETIRATALRELQEESGYELAPEGELIPLGYYFSSQGFTDEHCYIFMARGVVQSPEGHNHDAGEMIMETKSFSREELRSMIASNEIRDANSLCAYARMCARGLIG